MRIKKGAIGFEDSIYIVGFLFAIALFIVILFFTWSQISTPLDTAINSALPSGSGFNVTDINDKVSIGVGLFDGMFPFLLLGLLLMTIVSSFYTESHPMFFFISIILLAVVILLGVIFANVYQQITSIPELSSIAENDFATTTVFLRNFPVIVAIMFAVSAFILFAVKGRGGATNGL